MANASISSSPPATIASPIRFLRFRQRIVTPVAADVAPSAMTTPTKKRRSYWPRPSVNAASIDTAMPNAGRTTASTSTRPRATRSGSGTRTPVGLPSLLTAHLPRWRAWPAAGARAWRYPVRCSADGGKDPVLEVAEVDLVAEVQGERLDRSLGIVCGAVEAPIDARWTRVRIGWKSNATRQRRDDYDHPLQIADSGAEEEAGGESPGRRHSGSRTARTGSPSRARRTGCG